MLSQTLVTYSLNCNSYANGIQIKIGRHDHKPPLQGNHTAIEDNTTLPYPCCQEVQHVYLGHLSIDVKLSPV